MIATAEPTPRAATAHAAEFLPGIPGFTWPDLHDPVRLGDLTAAFDDGVRTVDAELFARYDAHRAGRAVLKGPEESTLLIALAAHLSTFVQRLFGLEDAARTLRAEAGRDAPLFRVKRDFVTRRVFKKGAQNRPRPDEVPAVLAEVEPLVAAAVSRDPRVSTAGDDAELALALLIDTLLDAEASLAAALAGKGDAAAVPLAAWRTLAGALGRGLADRGHDLPLAAALNALPEAPSEASLALVRDVLTRLDRYCFARSLDPHPHAPQRHWALFDLPRPVDHQNLVPLRRPRHDLPEALEGHEEHQRRRDGFKLTDPRGTARQIRSEIDYCIYCHERKKDSCSRGFKERGKEADPAAPYQRNPLGIPLTGCPLEERISEAHLVAGGGDAIGALALITIDNPMAPGTGHRICNDCMKACIYQKQDPVDIPQIETRILTDVLKQRWGYEVWSLLTRWNPLKCGPGQRQHPRAYTGINVLVVGMGPAGYTLAHHLLNEGFGVIGVDGLKIEPLPRELLGRGPGQRAPQAIEVTGEQFGKPLDERVLSGFGGVSEYGITVRWDKTFLDVLHLNLARRPGFRLYGGTRFGGTLTVDEAFARGIHHVALASGAGKPTIIGLKNNLIRGIRKASDFLMALQLTGAFKKDALANLHVRLPAVVIGGGLTAIDTATELAAYYPIQVEKLLDRHDQLCAASGEELVMSVLDPEEREVYAELLIHGRAVRDERARAAASGEAPDFAPLVERWGGVTIAYRKSLLDSPAYRLNHEEVIKALEEGIVFAECLSPMEAVPDAHGAVRALKMHRQRQENGRWRDTGEIVELPARTVCVAAGTSPNVTMEKEAPGSFEMDPETGAFRSYRVEKAADGTHTLVPGDVTEDLTGSVGFFTSYAKAGRFVSYFGDNHPVYAGSVVKAMASAKDGYPHIAALFAGELRSADERAARRDLAAAQEQSELNLRWDALTSRLDADLLATVHQVVRLTPTIVEVIIRAPAAARRFEPGQFYRLQNFEANARTIEGTKLLMEGLALTGAWVDRDAGLLSLIVLEMGASSRQVAALRPGEPVVVMGPTGAPSTIPRGEDVLLAGGGLGNAVLFSIAKALKQNGNRVVYFAGYKHARDIFKRDEIEAATDVVVWSVDKGTEPPHPRRAQDRAFSGNIVEAMVAYGTGALGEPPVPLQNVRRIIAIGSDRMMAAVTAARHAVLKPLLPADHVGIASINSPMQCMMKEICAQCLQKHRDPKTGKETVVFTCFDQDQPMDKVDWENLRARLKGNSLQEKLAALWLDRLLEVGQVERV